jgi:hypothetical protein
LKKQRGILAEVCEEAEAVRVVTKVDGILDSIVDSAVLASLAGIVVVLPVSKTEAALVTTTSLVIAASSC